MPGYDYHVHSNYSDGYFIPRMVEAAREAGLSGVGFADHCNVTAEGEARARLDGLGFDLDDSYERRRRGIEWAREEVSRDGGDIEIYDAVEMDYVPGAADRIGDFLEAADFDYAVGSVHSVDGMDVQWSRHFADMSDDERRAVVDRYYENLAALADSDLFEIAAHADLVERTPELRGYSTDDHYERVAAAFADSRTVPEVNAGRALGSYGEFHPAPPLFEAFRDAGVDFVVGSDAHAPGELRDRAAALGDFCADYDLEPVTLDVSG